VPVEAEAAVEAEEHGGGEQHAQRPAALDDAVQEAAPLGRQLLVDQRDGDRQLGVRQPGREGADDDEAPEPGHEERQAGEDGRADQRGLPHDLAPEAVHRPADDEAQHEHRAVDEERDGADLRLRHVQIRGDARQRDDEEVEVIRRERPADRRDDQQVDEVPGVVLGPRAKEALEPRTRRLGRP
jgi:hypothetical protein